MKKIIKQSVGIDIAKQKFDVCFQQEDANGKRTVMGTKSFNNNADGFKGYLEWCKKRKQGNSLTHVMEATGVYHEDLCYFLHDSKEKVCVELPQKIKYFSKTVNNKSKTDKKDAKLIALYGLSFDLELWEPISKNFKDIRDLCRLMNDLKKTNSAMKSRQSALQSKHETLKSTIVILSSTIKELEAKVIKCENKIMKLVEKDVELKTKIDRICEIKGITALTVIKLLSETDGFRKCSSIRKLVSYAGLDVSHNESGNKIGISRISKKGNSHIREAIYMPALSACRFDKNMNSFYKRLNKRQNAKKQGVVAVMRKLLVLVYTLWKNGQEYDLNHKWQGLENKRDEINSSHRIVKMTS